MCGLLELVYSVSKNTRGDKSRREYDDIFDEILISNPQAFSYL